MRWSRRDGVSPSLHTSDEVYVLLEICDVLRELRDYSRDLWESAGGMALRRENERRQAQQREQAMAEAAARVPEDQRCPGANGQPCPNPWRRVSPQATRCRKCAAREIAGRKREERAR